MGLFLITLNYEMRRSEGYSDARIHLKPNFFVAKATKSEDER